MKKKVLMICSIMVVFIIVLKYMEFPLRHILVRVFHKSGSIIPLDNNGKFDGEGIAYEEGVPIFRGTYKNGLVEGWGYSYYKTGELKNKLFFVHGKANGKGFGYYENGALWYTAYWKNDRKYGQGYRFLKNGQFDIYNTIDIDDQLSYYAVYDNSKLKQILGTIVSENIYSTLSQDSTVILKDSQTYQGITNLYLTVATPPKLITQLYITVNNRAWEKPRVKGNTVIVQNAFPTAGEFAVKVFSKLIDSTGKIIKADTLARVIRKQ